MRLVLILLLSCIHHSYGQSFVPVRGIITLNDVPLEGAHIANLSSQENSTSDSNGSFRIDVYVGTILLISHIGAEDKYVVIYDETLEEDPFIVQMQEKTNSLDEVVLEEGQRVTVQSVGIVQGEQYIPTTNERRLQTAGDFKAKDLLKIITQGALPITPILNAINGRTKRLKRYIEIDGEISIFESLYYYDAQFLEDRFGMSDEDIIRFLDSLVDHPEVSEIIRTDNDDQIRIWLCEQYLIFTRE